MVSETEIEALKTPAGGWTRETLAAWGVPWPPPKGWKAKLLGERYRERGCPEVWGRREEIAQAIRDRGFAPRITADDSYHIRVTKPGARGFVDYWPTTDRWSVNLVGGATIRNQGAGFEAMLTAAEQLPDASGGVLR